MASLDDLSQAKTWLDTFRPLPQEVAAELRVRFGVRLTHHSTAIEGNTLTQSEAETVVEKRITIGGKTLTEHLEVIGHQEALDFVYELAAGGLPLGEREIRELHSLVMKGQGNGDPGAYRTLDVMAAGTGFRYPSHLHVQELIDDFVGWLWARSVDLRVRHRPVLTRAQSRPLLLSPGFRRPQRDR